MEYGWFAFDAARLTELRLVSVGDEMALRDVMAACVAGRVRNVFKVTV